MRVVFFGAGAFGLPTLEMLHSRGKTVDLVRVVSRPDRPSGRGRKLTPTPVRARALELGIDCDTPEGANDPAYLDELASLKADVFIAVDYGEMLRRRLRELPRRGIFNLHPSLLPRYRGAAPVPHSLLAGEEVTGVTLFRIERKLDAGPIVDVEKVTVEPLETSGELEARLARVAAGLLERNLETFRGGDFQETPQDDELATFAPKLHKRDAAIDWNRDPVTLTNFVRAMNPWPAAWSVLRQAGRKPERTVFLRVRPAPGASRQGLRPGQVEDVRKDGFRIRCEGGAVEVLELQREGKAALPAAAYLQGRSLRPGDSFASTDASRTDP